MMVNGPRAWCGRNSFVAITLKFLHEAPTTLGPRRESGQPNLIRSVLGLLLSVEPNGAPALESALKFIGEPLLLGLLGNSCSVGEARFLGFALLRRS